MKCAEVQTAIGCSRIEELPPEVLVHAGKCSECGAELDKGQKLQQLLALKKYEIPDANAVERCLAAVHDKIGQQPARTKMWMFPQPVLSFVRYGVAASFLVMVGMHLLLLPSVTPLESALSSPVASTQVASRIPVAGTNDTLRYPFYNKYPANIQYGPVQSRLVDYKY